MLLLQKELEVNVCKIKIDIDHKLNIRQSHKLMQLLKVVENGK